MGIAEYFKKKYFNEDQYFCAVHGCITSFYTSAVNKNR